MALWGLIVVAALLIGSLQFFIGLTLLVPILDYATWHLYRKVIVRDSAQGQRPQGAVSIATVDVADSDRSRE